MSAPDLLLLGFDPFPQQPNIIIIIIITAPIAILHEFAETEKRHRGGGRIDKSLTRVCVEYSYNV